MVFLILFEQFVSGSLILLLLLSLKYFFLHFLWALSSLYFILNFFLPLTFILLYSAMLQTLAPLRPILFVGESGTAKTTVIQKYLHGLDNSVSTKLNINFSSKTTSADVQINVESNVDRRSGTFSFIMTQLFVILSYLTCTYLSHCVAYCTTI